MSDTVLKAFCEFSHASFMTIPEVGPITSHTLQLGTLEHREIKNLPKVMKLMRGRVGKNPGIFIPGPAIY